MVQISLIGIQTNDYTNIRNTLMAYADIHPGKIRLVEINDLNSIIKSAYDSIPVVMVGKRKVYFYEDRIEEGIAELRETLNERLEKTKAHNCKNCGNCSCPADQLSRNSSEDSRVIV